MAKDIEVEKVTRTERGASTGRGAVALSSAQVTDSRLVADAGSRSPDHDTAGRADMGAKGTQFVLASWASMYVGLWLIIAPFALTYAGYAPKAHANEMIIGALVASMGATRVFGNYRSGSLNRLISGLTVLPGIWLVFAPYVLNYSDKIRPTRVDIISGIAIILFSLWSLTTSRDDEKTTSTAR